MAGPIRISILANGSQAVREFSQVGSAASSVSSKISKYSKVAAGALLAVGVGMAKVGYDAVQMASDQEEALNKSNVIFGRQAKAVEAWSAGMAKSFGISQTEALASAATFGDMFNQLGFGIKETKKLSTGVVELAADLGSFHNLPTTDVLDSISGAMRGEYDSLQKLVPSINAARVEQVALATTGRKSAEALTAQEKAAATLKIIYGDTSKAQGDFARTSDSLANRSKRLNASLDDVQARIGRALLPVVIDAAEYFEENLLPAIEKGSRYLEDNQEAIQAAAREWGGHFLNVLQDVWAVLKPLLETINNLPGPLKEMALKVGLAAAAYSKLKGLTGPLITAQGSLVGSFSRTTREADKAARATGRFAGAARSAAGIGGLLLLSHGLSKSSDEAKGFESAFSKALGGALFLGPIGGVAALAASFGDLQAGWRNLLGVEDIAAQELADLAEQQDRAAEAADRHAAAIDGLTATLRGGQNTAASLEPAYANLEANLTAQGFTVETLNRQWRLMGVSQRTVAQATLGNETAQRRLTRAYRSIPIKDRLLQEHTLEDAISETNLVNKSAIKTERARLRLTQEWGGKLKSFPKEARTAIKLDGVQPTLRGLAKVTDKYDLTPEEVKTLLEVTGVEATVREVRRAAKEVKDTDGERAETRVDADTANAEDSVARFKANFLLLGRTPPVHTYTYHHIITAYEERGRPPSGGRATTVPREIGEADGDAYAEGFADAAGKRLATVLLKPAKDIGLKFLEGVTQGLSGVEAALDKATAYIERKIKAANDKAERARERRVLAHLKDEYAALRRIGKAIDEKNRKLEAARDRLQRLREEAAAYAAQIKQSVIDSGNITALGVNEDGSASITNILDELRDKVIRAQRFAALIRDLTAQGVNQTTISQLLAAGPDGGLAAAEAIASGGQAAIDEINDLTGQLTNVGAGLGADMADSFFGAQIGDAEDTLDRLLGSLEQLKAKARRRARLLAIEIRKYLRGSDTDQENDRNHGRRIGQGMGEGLLAQEARMAKMMDRLASGFATRAARDLRRELRNPDQRRLSAVGLLDASGDRLAAEDVNINVNVPPVANPAEVGRAVVSAVSAYYAAGGRRI